MTKGKKFDYRIVEDSSKWAAEITRRASAKKLVVSKRQDGFASEADAQSWAETELKSFVEKLEKQNKRRALLRK